MEISKLEGYLDLFNKIYDEYIDYEWEYKNGSNKKIKDRALFNAKCKIRTFEFFVEKDYELYSILTSETATDSHKAIIWNEFVSVQYFSRDLRDAIIKIKEMIKNKEN